MVKMATATQEKEEKQSTYMEVIIPVQRRQGTSSKARVSIPPINITSAFSSKDKKPHEYTDSQLEQLLASYEERLEIQPPRLSEFKMRLFLYVQQRKPAQGD